MIRPTDEIKNITTLINGQQERIEFLEAQIIRLSTGYELFRKALPVNTRIRIEEKIEERVGGIDA